MAGVRSYVMEALCFNEILSDAISEVAFNFFKDYQIDNLPCHHCGESCRKYIKKQGVDIYGQKIDNHDANGELVECPVCKKSVAASRFAPHLEKCIGLGRTGRSKRHNKNDDSSQLVANGDHPASEASDHTDGDYQEGAEKPTKRRRKSVSSLQKN